MHFFTIFHFCNVQFVKNVLTKRISLVDLAYLRCTGVHWPQLTLDRAASFCSKVSDIGTDDLRFRFEDGGGWLDTETMSSRCLAVALLQSVMVTYWLGSNEVSACTSASTCMPRLGLRSSMAHETPSSSTKLKEKKFVNHYLCLLSKLCVLYRRRN